MYINILFILIGLLLFILFYKFLYNNNISSKLNKFIQLSNNLKSKILNASPPITCYNMSGGIAFKNTLDNITASINAIINEWNSVISSCKNSNYTSCIPTNVINTINSTFIPLCSSYGVTVNINSSGNLVATGIPIYKTITSPNGNSIVTLLNNFACSDWCSGNNTTYSSNNTTGLGYTNTGDANWSNNTCQCVSSTYYPTINTNNIISCKSS